MKLFSQNSNLYDHDTSDTSTSQTDRTDRRTDRKTTCLGNTALRRVTNERTEQQTDKHLCCVECLELSVTQLRSIEHTWLCAISHIFHITGSHVKLVSDFAGKIRFSDMLQDRRKRFLDGLRFVDNSVLQFMSVLV